MTNEREAADDQWFGDMMILQVLADSATVNDQEREVLQRWLAAAERPSQAAAQEPKINYSVLHEWAEDWNIDYNGLCRTVRSAVAAPAEGVPSRPKVLHRMWYRFRPADKHYAKDDFDLYEPDAGYSNCIPVVIVREDEFVRAFAMANSGGSVNHIYAGNCPDEAQPDAHDPECPACRASQVAHARPPPELERWGITHANGNLRFERMRDGYWTPWHLADEALRAAGVKGPDHG